MENVGTRKNNERRGQKEKGTGESVTLRAENENCIVGLPQEGKTGIIFALASAGNAEDSGQRSLAFVINARHQ